MAIAVFLSITLLTLCFPTAIGDVKFPDMGALVWIGWVPFFLAYRKRSKGLVGGAFLVSFGYYLLSMYWLFYAMRNYGGLSGVIAVLVLVLLCVILAAYATLAIALAGIFERHTCQRHMCLPLWATLPVTWTLMEWARERFPLGGYPWSNLAYALGQYPYFMQSAEIVGASGLAGMILLVNILIADGLALRRARPLVAAGAVLIACLGFGYLRASGVAATVNAVKRAKPAVSVALVQGNIAQSDKWDRHEVARIDAIYRERSMLAFERGAHVVIWPEAAYPHTIARNTERIPMFDDWLQPGQALLFGALTRSGEKSYNSALIVAPDEIIDRVDKVHLVPFGEYVPYRTIFRFARTLTQAVGNFYPGDAHVLTTPYGKWGVLICYEDLFPVLARDLVQRGAEVLVNLTNDAWYEHSSAAYQHLVYSQFRAVESRRYLLRATNTGITAVINPLGQVEAQLPWFVRKNLQGPVWPISPNEIKSLYFIYNYIFIGLMLGLLVYFLIRLVMTRRYGSTR